MTKMDITGKTVARTLGVVTAVALMLGGCAGTAGQAPEKTSGPPAWIVRGGGVTAEAGRRAFQGVGSVTGVRTKSLAESASANRARADVARVFEEFAAGVMRDYVAAVGAANAVGANTATSETQYVDRSVRSIAAATLSGTMIVDRWVDPNDGSVYALAQLDFDKFQQALDGAVDLSPEAKAYARQNAGKKFDAFADEQAKRRR